MSYGGRTWELGPKWANRVSPQEFVDQTNAEGGASRHAFTAQKPPSTGYMVGGAITERGHQMHDEVLQQHHFDARAVEAHARSIQRQFHPTDEVYQGSWKQGDKVTLDASTYLSHRLMAKQMGRERNQEAIYDLGRGQDIPMAGAHKAGTHKATKLDPATPRTDGVKGGKHRYEGKHVAGVRKAGKHKA